ncbi:MAG: hypothetical protein K2X82_31530 [Gemmataceae bacterium]|nr:hypothetical protein [Gemmataceae bacterium]
MRRSLLLAAGFSFFAGAVLADDPKPKDSDPDVVTGTVADATLAKKAPDLGVLVKKAEFDDLVKLWAVEKPFKVDWAKHLVVVGTSQGSGIELKTTRKNGDLKVQVLGTADLRPGFRYAFKRVDRDGLETINGKPLPKGESKKG